MNYLIMHKDRIVAEIRDDGTCTIHSESFMPFNLWFEEDDSVDSRVNNLANFYYWCSSRVLTLDRVFAKEILNSLGQNQAVTDRERAAIAMYDDLDGAACQTTDRSRGRISQKDAAVDAVKEVGLNMKKEPIRDLFSNDHVYSIFSQRLRILKEKC